MHSFHVIEIARMKTHIHLMRANYTRYAKEVRGVVKLMIEENHFYSSLRHRRCVIRKCRTKSSLYLARLQF